MYYFLVFAIGMTSAAWLGHGFQAYISDKFKMIGWICGATGIMFLQMGSLQSIKSILTRNVTFLLITVFVIQYVVAVSCMIGFFNFKVVQLNSVIGLWGFVLPLQLFAHLKCKKEGANMVILALLYSVIPGLIYSNQISISKWFNYHDISHVLMAGFMTLMFVGLRKLILSETMNN